LLAATEKKRPLFTHETQGANYPACYAQKLSPSINVELVVGLEVFGWAECAGHLYIALVLSFIYGIGDALSKSLDKDLRNPMEQDHDTTFHTRDHHPRPA
jgi:hypothetical protein